MPLPDHKTKIVATIGPASSSPEMLARLIAAGLDIARLNFSHGEFESHAAVIPNIRAAQRAAGRRVSIMADLPGPKMRIGQFGSETVELIEGRHFTLTTEEIYLAFLGEQRDLRAFFHGHTYTGNPLACAAAAANIDLLRKEKTLQRLQPKIKLLAKGLSEMRKLAHVGEVRQKGFMVGIELVKSRLTKEPYLLDEKIGIRVVQECRKNGLIIRPLGNVIVLMPPLSMSPQELGRMMDIVHAAIKLVTEKA